MEAEKAKAARGERPAQARGKILMATVKGDVHDIGKNIVGVVLGCNDYEVIDLGVMVPCETILQAARERRGGHDRPVGADHAVARRDGPRRQARWSARGSTMPLLIGGATTSAKHTAVKIAPAYHGPVVHVKDASRSVGVVDRLMPPGDSRAAARPREPRAQQEGARGASPTAGSASWSPTPRRVGDGSPSTGRRLRSPCRRSWATRVLRDFPLTEIVPYIDWSPFFMTWELKGKYPQILADPNVGAEARKLFDDAAALAGRIIVGRS